MFLATESTREGMLLLMSLCCFCVRVPVPQCTSTPLVLRAQRYRSKHTHMTTHNYQLHVPDYAEVLALSALHQYITLLYCYHRYIKHLSCIAML